MIQRFFYRWVIGSAFESLSRVLNIRFRDFDEKETKQIIDVLDILRTKM
jgi:hypothetical protein